MCYVCVLCVGRGGGIALPCPRLPLVRFLIEEANHS